MSEELKLRNLSVLNIRNFLRYVIEQSSISVRKLRTVEAWSLMKFNRRLSRCEFRNDSCMTLLYASNLSNRNALAIYARRLIMHSTLRELIYEDHRGSLL